MSPAQANLTVCVCDTDLAFGGLISLTHSRPKSGQFGSGDWEGLDYLRATRSGDPPRGWPKKLTASRSRPLRGLFYARPSSPEQAPLRRPGIKKPAAFAAGLIGKL